jgi:hypothetical protein
MVIGAPGTCVAVLLMLFLLFFVLWFAEEKRFGQSD